MEKIKSKYILQTIMAYIRDDNIKLKLFMYSKKYQNIFSIQLFNYQKKYFDIIGINPLSKYLSLYTKGKKYESESNLHKYDGKYPSYGDEIEYNGIDFWLNDLNLSHFEYPTYIFFDTYALQEDLLKYKIKIDIKDYFYKYFKKYSNELKIQKLLKIVDQIIIDNNQPFFDILYKLDIFEGLFILIDVNKIEKYNIKDKYISAFNKLNKINSNYSSITFCFKEDTDIKYLKQFDINFNQIKNLKIKYLNINNKPLTNYNKFFEELFTLKIKESLISLDFDLTEYSNSVKDINIKYLEHLNEFKSLSNLTLRGFNLKEEFELKINRLKSLNIEDSSNIILKGDEDLPLKDIRILSNSQISSKSLLELPNLECLDYKYIVYNKFINFTSLKNLLKLHTDEFCEKIIMEVENFPLLEFVELIGEDLSEKTFKKILSIKTLKEISFHLFNTGIDLGLDEIFKIDIQNLSIKKLDFYIGLYRYDLEIIRGNEENSFCDFENKFPNLLDLKLFINRQESSEYASTEIKIEENPNCKINKIDLTLNGGTNTLKFYCQPFENLEIIKINITQESNILKSLPMFKDNNKTIYKSLIELDLNFYSYISSKRFNNISNCINNMPNLKRFYFHFNTNKINKKKYEDFINKILSLNLEIICIGINKCNEKYDYYYSFKELKNINTNINFLNYENIKIKHYNKNKFDEEF